MPIFEYKCEKCGKNFEKIIRGKTSQTDCIYCGSSETTKQISSFSASGAGGKNSGGGHSCSSCSGHSCSSCH